MKQELISKTCSKSTRINRYAYCLYILLVIYFAIKGDYEWAFINLGVALVFDPFDTTVKWQYRKFYQKAWLLAHVAIMLAGMIYLYFQKH
jgi:hypothetical protein